MAKKKITKSARAKARVEKLKAEAQAKKPANPNSINNELPGAQDKAEARRNARMKRRAEKSGKTFEATKGKPKKKTTKPKTKAKAKTPKRKRPPRTPKSPARVKGKKRLTMNAKQIRLRDTESKLRPIAKEINVRFERADKYETQADDHRLAAALQLAQARKMCHSVKISFKDWCDTNVTTGYETVRKLAVIGSKPNPRLALEDMRHKNKIANKNMRDRNKVTKAKSASKGSRDTKSNNPASNGIDEIKSAFDDLKAKQRMTVARYTAREVGCRLQAVS